MKEWASDFTVYDLFKFVFCGVLLLTILFHVFYMYDVMHEVFTVTCLVRMPSGAWTTCCAVLSWLLTGLLSPVSCPLFLGCPGRHLSLRLLVTTSQFCIKGNSFSVQMGWQVCVCGDCCMQVFALWGMYCTYVCNPLLLSVASCQFQVRSQDTDDDAHTHTHMYLETDTQYA